MGKHVFGLCKKTSAHISAAISAFDFPCLDSIDALVSKFQISNLQLFRMRTQISMCIHPV